MSNASINLNLRTRTTLKIDKTLLSIFKRKNFATQSIIRDTLQFIFVIYKYTNQDLEDLLISIFDEYDSSEDIPLSKTYNTVNTHITKSQKEAYDSINLKSRVFYLNKLISIIINNKIYYNINNNSTIKSDSVINQYTIDYFLSNIDKNKKIVLMKSLLTKLNNSFISNIGLYNNLYESIFTKEEALDFYNQSKLSNFLLNEFEKIYFSMIKVFEIKLNLESSKSFTRSIHNKYAPTYKQKYNKDIASFIESEIIIDNTMSTAVLNSAVFRKKYYEL